MGTHNVFSHPFFTGIDWKQLELLQVTPPYVPSDTLESDLSCCPKYSSFQQLIVRNASPSWLVADGTEEDIEEHFQWWNYSSVDAIALENKKDLNKSFSFGSFFRKII